MDSSNTLDTLDTTSQSQPQSQSQSQLQPQSPYCIHSELKKLSPTERCKLLEKITKEEYEAEQQRQLQEQEQEKTSKYSNSPNCNNNKQFNEIMLELRSLRMQVYELKYNSQLCRQQQCQIQQPLRQSTLQSRQSTRQSSQPQCPIRFISNISRQSDIESNIQSDIQSIIDDEYEQAKEECSSLFSWMPLWIFIAFVLFALTSKPKCSIIGGGITGFGDFPSCPLKDLGISTQL